jgi:phosphatidate cytidylyltransferase
MAGAKTSSDLFVRTVAGIFMIAIAVIAILLGGWTLRFLVLLAASLMLFEWSDMHRVPRLWPLVGSLLLSLILLPMTERLYPAGEIDEAITTASFAPAWTGLALCVAAGLVVGLLSRRLSMLWGFTYIAVPSFSLLVLGWVDYALVFWAFIVTWATDIFAYFAGRSIGGPKLAPRISPNKTWSGLAGGVIGATALGWATASWFGLGEPYLYIGGAMGLLAQLGDLYESRVKRKAGVKDSGRLLPGHGGVLDRLDGLLPVAIATLALAMAGLWVE